MSPIIVFQVYSVGWFDRHRLEGYGHFRLSDQVSLSFHFSRVYLPWFLTGRYRRHGS